MKQGGWAFRGIDSHYTAKSAVAAAAATLAAAAAAVLFANARSRRISLRRGDRLTNLVEQKHDPLVRSAVANHALEL